MRNNKLYVLAAALFALSSCAGLKDFHQYRAEHSFKVKAEFDDVWEEVIDYVSENNYEITNIEKESGLITIKPCRFKASFQVKGKQNNMYYYAVQNYPKYKKCKLYVVGNWNIRVKPVDHWVTRINVNLVDNGEVIAVDKDKKEYKLELSNQSTGTFEKMIMYNILDNLRKRDFDIYDYSEYDGENH